MKLITSKDNPVFKDLKQLATSSQARRRAGQSEGDESEAHQICDAVVPCSRPCKNSLRLAKRGLRCAPERAPTFPAMAPRVGGARLRRPRPA